MESEAMGGKWQGVIPMMDLINECALCCSEHERA